MKQPRRKKDGFAGQKAIIIPRNILKTRCEQNDIAGPLFITDIGYYPKARCHYRERSHGADQYILIYCVEGKGRARIRSIDYAVRAGEFIIVPIHESHRYSADESDPWTIYWIHFKGSHAGPVAALLQKKLEGHKGFVHFTEARIQLFNRMYEQLERGYEHDNLAYANMCLWHFLSTFIFQEADKLQSGISEKKDNINYAIDLMGQKVDCMLTLEEIAKFVHLSASHFSSLFKKKTGFSPIEYFNQLKMQKACQYLLFSDLRVKEIAFKLGIEDPYYFSRLFTKTMGMPPNEYRDRKIH